MNTRVRETVLQTQTVKLKKPIFRPALIPLISDTDTKQQNEEKRIELISQKNNFETRLTAINVKLKASINNRYHAGTRIPLGTFEMEEAFQDEKQFILIELKRVNEALSILNLQRRVKNSFNHPPFDFMRAAKRILDDSTYNRIIAEAEHVVEKPAREKIF